MAAVSQKTLTWLYSVLGRTYRDPNRTYSDCAQVLSQYPSFSPRTDVYTFENGSSALLVRFIGTIQVTFRGASYRFPISLWIPYGYPQEGPLVYVTPTEQMAVRPGQHVSGEGRIYHHYLAHWGDSWDRSNLVDFLFILSDIFAKEPPLISKQQPATRHTMTLQQEPGPPPPVPPLPQELKRSPPQTSQTASSESAPPPPPPKESASNTSGASSPDFSRRSRYDAPPPLPSQVGLGSGGQPPFASSYPTSPLGRTNGSTQYVPQRSSSLRQSLAHQQIQDLSAGGQYHYEQSRDSQNPGSPARASDMSLHSQTSSIKVQGIYQQPAPQPQFHQQKMHPNQHLQDTPHPLTDGQQPQPYQSPHQYMPPPHGQQQPPQYRHQQPQQPQPKPKPPTDLLDSPFDVSLPVASTANIPAPPIPRNPEKDALLSSISSTIVQNLHNTISQNTAALPALHSQHQALISTHDTLSSELAQLTQLSSTLTSNISVLQSSLHTANGAIAAAQERATKGEIPNVDEMLTAPTVVGKQLYDVVCEERGIEAGIWALQEGFVRGRVSVEVWARKTRELSREGFRRRVLAGKIGRGMGLETR